MTRCDCRVVYHFACQAGLGVIRGLLPGEAGCAVTGPAMFVSHLWASNPQSGTSHRFMNSYTAKRLNRLPQGFSPYALTRFRDQIAIPPVGTLSRRDFRSQPGVLTRETHPHNDPPCRGGRYLRSTVCLVNLCKREAPLSTAPSASPTRYAGAIRTRRSTPTLQYSITPRGRIRGRRRSAL